MATPILITVRHRAEQSATAINYADFITGIQDADNLVSVSWNNMWGEFQDTPVNLKKKTIWKFDCISDADLNRIYNINIRNKQITYRSRFFYVKSLYLGQQEASETLYYLGTPTNFTLLGRNGGEETYYSGEIHWIEVLGTRLNNPATAGSNT